MSSYRFGSFCLDAAERTLTRYGKTIPLPRKAYETLLALVENRGHVVEKETLMKVLWPDAFVEEANLTQNIFKLRKALADSRRKTRYIETVPRRGYRFVAKVEYDPGSLRTRADMSCNSRDSSGGEAEVEHIRSLAVLPLENASGDAGLDYLSDGITESIINALAQLPHLRVTARSTVFRLKGRIADPVEAAREIGVRAVLTGRVHQVGDELIIGTELIDATDATQIWGARYSRSLSGLLDVQEGIAREVSETLRLRLLGGAASSHSLKRHTESVAAYRLYLKGRYYWNKRLAADLHRGIDCFRQAIDEDPAYALAYVGLADCYDQLCGLSAMEPHEGYPKAKAASQRALEFDEELAEAHASLGHVSMRYDWDWATAEREYRRAIELNPSYATARHWYAIYLTITGQHEDAIKEAHKARQLDPLSPIIDLFIGAHLFFARRYDDAIAHCRAVSESEPGFILAHTFLTQAYAHVSRHEEARSSLNRARELSGEKEDSSLLLQHGYIHALAGRTREAREALATLERRTGREFINPFEIAKIHVILGEADKAFAWLEKAYRERVGDLIFLRVAPEFDSIREDSRFNRLLERVGLKI